MHTTSVQKARHFRSLHDALHPLLLGNCWDAGSALVSEAAGVQSVATTIAGVAWSLGLADGDHLDRTRAISAVASIAAAVAIPVTADIEGATRTPRQTWPRRCKAFLRQELSASTSKTVPDQRMSLPPGSRAHQSCGGRSVTRRCAQGPW